MLLIWIFILYLLCSLKTSGLFFFGGLKEFFLSSKSFVQFWTELCAPKAQSSWLYSTFESPRTYTDNNHKANLKKKISNIWVCVGVNNSVTLPFFFGGLLLSFAWLHQVWRLCFLRSFQCYYFTLNSWINHKTRLFVNTMDQIFVFYFFLIRMLCVLGILI